jgi:hypothetical protein
MEEEDSRKLVCVRVLVLVQMQVIVKNQCSCVGNVMYYNKEYS